MSRYFSQSKFSIRAYILTSAETELLQRILDYHLNNKVSLHITQSNDHLIEFEQLLDFISHIQELMTKTSANSDNLFVNKSKIPSIPTSISTYNLPSVVKSIIPTCSSMSQPKHSIPSKSKTNESVVVGWIQINNVCVPFIVQNRQRFVPYQVLVSCKILEPGELRHASINSTQSDISSLNKLIHDSKFNNEIIPNRASLINVHHVLIGTKNLIYAKVLPQINPISQINRDYKDILQFRGGLITQTIHPIPFICTNNCAYIPLHYLLNIYPNLYNQLKEGTRVPRAHEFEYLQLIQMYLNEKELPLDTILIDLDYLLQEQICFSQTIFLNEYHLKEKSKFEQRFRLFLSSVINKRKHSQMQSPKNSSYCFSRT